MQTKPTIRQIMEELVAVPSDTGTQQEKNAAQKIAAYFAEDPYFRAHPDCWVWQIPETFWGDPSCGHSNAAPQIRS